MGQFDKWNEAFTDDDLKDINDLSSQSFREVPVGTYEVKIEKLELKESKTSQKLMMFVQFRILQGDYENSCLFMNQIVSGEHRNQGIGNAKRFLNSLGLRTQFEFSGDYNKFSDYLLDAMEEIEDQLEYLLEYKQSKTGFPIYTIKEIYEI